MKDIYTNLSNPSWWVSVLFGGVVISIVSNVIYSLTKKMFFHSLDKYTISRVKRKEQERELIERLKMNRQLFHLYLVKFFFSYTSIFLLGIMTITLNFMGVFLLDINSAVEGSNSVNSQIVIYSSYGVSAFTCLITGAKLFYDMRKARIIYTVLNHFGQGGL
ncbi:hypothetical protein [Parapedobacter lycopersici]|uniref:hypothetical protein n=1 Tax=Parapedobacter lycopersici TaxID=1864939 RepID=UPI00333E69A1